MNRKNLKETSKTYYLTDHQNVLIEAQQSKNMKDIVALPIQLHNSFAKLLLRRRDELFLWFLGHLLSEGNAFQLDLEHSSLDILKLQNNVLFNLPIYEADDAISH